MSDYVNDFIAKMDAQMAELKANDKAAAEAGTLVGRYIQEQIADGHAYYVVTAENGKFVEVAHVDYCDGYRVPMIESMEGIIPAKYARENIAMRDRWATMFKTDKL